MSAGKPACRQATRFHRPPRRSTDQKVAAACAVMLTPPALRCSFLSRARALRCAATPGTGLGNLQISLPILSAERIREAPVSSASRCKTVRLTRANFVALLCVLSLRICSRLSFRFASCFALPPRGRKSRQSGRGLPDTSVRSCRGADKRGHWEKREGDVSPKGVPRYSPDLSFLITRCRRSTPDKACHRTFIDFHEADRGRPAAAPAAAAAAKTLLGRRRAPTNRCHRPGRLSLALRWTTRSALLDSVPSLLRSIRSVTHAPFHPNRPARPPPRYCFYRRL